jgi:hypothetical protein
LLPSVLWDAVLSSTVTRSSALPAEGGAPAAQRLPMVGRRAPTYCPPRGARLRHNAWRWRGAPWRALRRTAWRWRGAPWRALRRTAWRWRGAPWRARLRHNACRWWVGALRRVVPHVGRARSAVLPAEGGRACGTTPADRGRAVAGAPAAQRLPMVGRRAPPCCPPRGTGALRRIACRGRARLRHNACRWWVGALRRVAPHVGRARSAVLPPTWDGRACGTTSADGG